MKKTTILFAAAACLLATSCASKKDLVNCQNENRELQSSYSATKEQLAAANSRVTSLEEALAAQKQQLEDQKKAYARLQKTLDQSVANASQNNISIDKLVDQINESNQYIRHLVEVKSKLPTFSAWFKDMDPEEYTVHHAIIQGFYKEYTARRQVKYAAELLEDPDLSAYLDLEEYLELRTSLFDQLVDGLQQKLNDSNISKEEFLYHCDKLSHEYANFNWGFAWDVLGDSLIQLIPQGKSFAPVRDPSGQEYLGERYSLQEVTNKDEIAIQNLWLGIFGDIEDDDIKDLLPEDQGGDQ